jgi:hypothetical protein
VEGEPVPDRLAIVRLDPARFSFRVHYDPLTPRTVSGWAERLGSLLVVNGGYFTPENQTIGLLIAEEGTFGTPYGDFAGMFGVTPDDAVFLHWLRERPYDPQIPLRAGIQSFPVLVKPGGVMGFPADADEGRPARRTVVARDRTGAVLLIVAPRGNLSLHLLAAFLAGSDLEIDIALNLDGGTSTGLWSEAWSLFPAVDSLIPVPSILAVDRR